MTKIKPLSITEITAIVAHRSANKTYNQISAQNATNFFRLLVMHIKLHLVAQGKARTEFYVLYVDFG